MFRDKRAKKIAIVANCLLNQNAKVAELADYPAQVPGLTELLCRYDFGIEQLPCPETYTVGVRRFWQVKPQYQTRGISRDYDFLAEVFLDRIEDYLRNGFTVVLIGVDGSPSCGINITDSDDHNLWLGRPCLTEEQCGAGEDAEIFREGQGAFIDKLDECLRRRGLDPVPSFGLSLDIQGRSLDFSGLEEFLQRHAAAE